MAPQSRRRILLITAGGTPQVVTETLHHLATKLDWWPEEVVLLTTARGDQIYADGDRARGIAPLLGAGGKLASLATTLGRPLPAIRSHAARLPGGALIEDIRSEAEVMAFADDLLAEIRRATEGDTEVHLSLAGGRKTMSYIAGAVLSLYGRPQDTLSHVLVEPQTLEGAPDFWWPGQPEPPAAPGLDAAAAVTRLHSVPFIRLRAYLPEDEAFRGGALSFADAVGRANAALDAEILTIDIDTLRISAGPHHTELRPAEFALYRLLAHVRKHGWSVGGVGQGVTWLDGIAFGERADGGGSLLSLLGDMHEEAWKRGRKADHLRAAQEREDFAALNTAATSGGASSRQRRRSALANKLRPHISRIRTAVRRDFPVALARRIQPQSVSGGVRHGLTIDWDPERIEIVGTAGNPV
jgi:CRISPR-associated protein (TIGR02584 family)